MTVDSCDVLVVDDDVEIRETLVEVLEERGYRAVAAANGKLALDTLHEGTRPKVILLDMMMPEMDGPTFRAQQRREPAIADIPVVVISAHSDLEENARRLGAATALSKPISFRDLLTTLKSLVRGGGRRLTPVPV